MKLPTYFRQPIPNIKLFEQRQQLFNSHNINTVCRSAHCPNQARCLEENTATFMILGNVCMRGCLFCGVDKGDLEPLDQDEPYNIAHVVKKMLLDYVVITSVCRDDLDDFGVRHFVKVIDSIRLFNQGVKIELLIPDFGGSPKALDKVVRSLPDCIGHNLETVPRLYRKLNRSSFYETSLEILARIKKVNADIFVKSGIMLGLGEKKEEIVGVLKDLKSVGCDIVTLGQYLSPSKRHFPVKRYLSISEFEEYKQIASDLGFAYVLSGPLVRSSYKAGAVYQELIKRRNRT